MMLKGKVAVVTGAGRGIGRGIAIAMAQAGAKVVVNDLGVSLSGVGADASPANQVVDEIRKAGGVAVPNHGSVTDFRQAAEMVEQAVTMWGRLDILVNVAGNLRDRMIFNMSEEDWDAVLDVHLKGSFNTMRAATVRMREQKSGRIISMSSVSALGAPGQPNYAAAKAGIIGLTWSTANAMAKYGVTVNAVMPSGATRMFDTTPRAREAFEQTGKWPSEVATGTDRDPDNVAPLVVYLASDAAAQRGLRHRPRRASSRGVAPARSGAPALEEPGPESVRGPWRPEARASSRGSTRWWTTTVGARASFTRT